MGVFLLAWGLLTSSEASGQTLVTPSLSIQPLSGSAVRIGWSGAGFELRTSESLGDGATWSLGPWTVTSEAANNLMTIPLDARSRYFRLFELGSALPPPASFSVKTGDNILYLDWSPVPGAVAYRLYVSTDPTVGPSNYFLLPAGMVYAGLPLPQAVLNNLSPGIEYYFVVTATDSKGEESQISNRGSAIFGPVGEVHGSFYAMVFDGTQYQRVTIPGVKVTLQGTNGVSLSNLVSEGDGTFMSPSLPAGTYQVCWSAPGFAPGCLIDFVTLDKSVTGITPQQLFPLPDKDLVFGSVNFADGSPAVFMDAGFGLNVRATISAKDPGGVILASVKPNDLGYFVMGGLPAHQAVQLSADMEAASTTINLDSSSVPTSVNLVLPGSPPTLHVAAYVDGTPAKLAPPGAKVQFQVGVDSIHPDSLTYTWQSANSAAAGLTPANTSVIACQLPSSNCPVKVEVLVGDGHGGYAVGSARILAQTEAMFSGSVRDSQGQPAAEVIVEVNGVSSKTDSQGAFTVLVPVNSAYALTITAPGHLPLARSFADSSLGDSYNLTPLPEPMVANWVGSAMQFPDATGSSLQIPDLGLVDQGVPYTGSISVRFRTLNPCTSSGEFPAGNLVAGGTKGSQFLMAQAGAFLEILGDQGQVLELNPGNPATITWDSSAVCGNYLPASVALQTWTWDWSSGNWLISGEASSQAQGQFSGRTGTQGIIALGGPAPTTVVSISGDRSINLPVQLRITGQPDLVIQQDPGDPFAQVLVPQNQPITFQVLNPKEAPGEYYGNPNDASTLRPTANKTVIFQLTRTFTNANAEVFLSLSNHIPVMRTARTGGNGRFLSYESRTTIAGNQFQAGDVYYNAINFSRARNNFQNWMVKNGFLPTGGTYPRDYVEDANAIYFNATDLGFARSMHMRKTAGADGKTNIAYYVVNYPTLEGALADRPGTNLPPGLAALATVAMDYAYDTTSSNRITKFYIFDFGSAPTRALRPVVDLDGGGNKVNPNLCVVCHGSSPVGFEPTNSLAGYRMVPADGHVGGHFIPFDLESFTYSTNAGVQKAAFRELNRGIYLYTPMTAAMSNLLTGWYGGGLTNGNNNEFRTGFVPAGWSAQASLYTNTVRVSCRGCHAMRDEPLGFGTFNNFSNQVSSTSLVCSELKMPNAQRTFTIFWGSQTANLIRPGVVTNQPVMLTNVFGWCPCPTTR